MKKFVLPVILIKVVLFILVLEACNRTKTIKPVRKSITEAVYASGYIVPYNEYKVYALSDGYITAKYKNDGDDIKKGESIFKVQNDAFAAKLSATSAVYDLAKRNNEENSPVLGDLKNKIKSAEAKLKNDSINYTRYKNMYDAKAVTKTQFDQAELAYQVSGNDLKSAMEQYKRTRDQLQVDLKNAQSAVTSSGTDLANYTISSMLGGEVYQTFKELGEAVRRNDYVALIGEKGKKKLQLSVDQQDIQKVKTGLEVIVKMDVTGSKIYKAKISKVYPNMNQNDQSFKVEAEFSENYDLNFVHASVEANIIIDHKENVLVIPKTALQGSDEVELKSMGMNQRVKIKKGIENLEFVEVLSGIKEGDEVVPPKEK